MQENGAQAWLMGSEILDNAPGSDPDELDLACFFPPCPVPRFLNRFTISVGWVASEQGQELEVVKVAGNRVGKTTSSGKEGTQWFGRLGHGGYSGPLLLLFLGHIKMNWVQYTSLPTEVGILCIQEQVRETVWR